MGVAELAVWSMSLGAIGAFALGRAIDLVARPSSAQWQGMAFHVTVFLLVLIQSGVAAHLWPAIPAQAMHVAQVMAGPLCVGLSNFWIRGWLKAAQRDRVMCLVLRGNALALPLMALACLGLPVHQQLPAAAVLTLAGGVLTLWLNVRAWLMGDRLAVVMAAGCALTIPAIAGLHAIALDLPGIGLATHVTVATAAALCNALTGLVLWRRDRHEWRAHNESRTLSRIDPVTRLHNGTSLVRKLIQAQERRRRTRKEGALLAILVFDLDRIAAQVGTVGVNEMFICLASRIQRQVGVINPVGRYWEQCFVSLVETIGSPGWLRTLGLRLASNLRRPMWVKTASGERVQITADVGIGMVHLAGEPAPVEDILDDAQAMARAARGMRSRAALLNDASGEAMPVEEADLGPRRHKRRIRGHHAH